jgi:hypothetical protein
MVVNRPLDDQPPPEDPIDGFSLDADQRQPTLTWPAGAGPSRARIVTVVEIEGDLVGVG